MYYTPIRQSTFFLCLVLILGMGCTPPAPNNNAGESEEEVASSNQTKKKNGSSNDTRNSRSILSRSLDRARELTAAEQAGLRLTQTKLHLAQWIQNEPNIETTKDEGVLSVDVTFEWMGDGFDLDLVQAVDADNDQIRLDVVKKYLKNTRGGRIADAPAEAWPKPGTPVRVELLYVAPSTVKRVHLQLGKHSFTTSPRQVSGKWN